jgi:hypothetical protein
VSISLTRSTSVRAGLAQRVRIVLLAADGLPWVPQLRAVLGHDREC